jgi:hypothetical protein
MAEQKGIFPLQGTIGNINFYKSGDGYHARGKGGPSALQIATNPNFQRTRENAAEFGTAARASKLLRTAFRTLLPSTPDERMVSRLNGKMVNVLQTDVQHARGMRKVNDGNAGLLEGFEFNDAGKMSITFCAQYISDINRATGELKITIPPFIPHNLVNAPQGATHFKLIAGGAEVDFENKSHSADLDCSVDLPWNSVPTAEIVLSNFVTANSSLPLFLVLGIEFYQEVNEWMYPLKSGAHNALTIVKVSVE